MLRFLIGFDSSRLFSEVTESAEGFGRFSSVPESIRKRGGSGGRSAPSKSVEQSSQEGPKDAKRLPRGSQERLLDAPGGSRRSTGRPSEQPRAPQGRQEAAKRRPRALPGRSGRQPEEVREAYRARSKKHRFSDPKNHQARKLLGSHFGIKNVTGEGPIGGPVLDFVFERFLFEREVVMGGARNALVLCWQ